MYVYGGGKRRCMRRRRRRQGVWMNGRTAGRWNGVDWMTNASVFLNGLLYFFFSYCHSSDCPSIAVSLLPLSIRLFVYLCLALPAIYLFNDFHLSLLPFPSSPFSSSLSFFFASSFSPLPSALFVLCSLSLSIT